MIIPITPRIGIDEQEIEFSFIRASGPGGQNVNKTSSAVQLRFDVRQSPSLPAPVRERLERLAGRRLTRDGVLVIAAQRFRTQILNKDDAMARLIALVQEACIVPVYRRPTKPTKSSQQRRLGEKSHRATIKGLRGSPGGEE